MSDRARAASANARGGKAYDRLPWRMTPRGICVVRWTRTKDLLPGRRVAGTRTSKVLGCAVIMPMPRTGAGPGAEAAGRGAGAVAA